MKVLLPLDDAPCSTAAVDAVLAQFRPAATEVRLLHVVEWYLTMGEGPAAGADLLAFRDKAFREGEALTARAAERLQAAGFQTTAAVVPGVARDTIIEAAAEWKPDLIVIGSHGRKALNRLLLGSVSHAIVRQAACSVEIVKAPGHLAAEELAAASS